jgi:biopolymer transport protein ExbB
MFDILGYVIYGVLFVIALWGAYCCVMVWTRVNSKKFNSEFEQLQFLEAIEEPLSQGDYDTAVQICEGDRRALCQLSQMAIENRKLGFAKVKQLVADRFQRDVLEDIEHLMTWITTVIKAAPMIGLLGTVMGMMQAFSELASATSSGEGVKVEALAEDIMFALITTACGLAIAIPLVLALASVNVQLRKLEDLCAYGLNQFLEIFKEASIRHP